VKALHTDDTDVIQAATLTPPASDGAAADRIVHALGIPDVIGEKANLASFVVRRCGSHRIVAPGERVGLARPVPFQA
jgi:hypothetical protein